MFRSYPIRNSYVFYLPQCILFGSYNSGGLKLMDIHIYTEPSPHDCPSDDHRFNTLHCNVVNDADSAWVIGLELVSLLRGLVTIFDGESQQRFVKIEKMIDEANPAKTYPNHDLNFDVNISPQLYKKLGDNLMINLSFQERQEYKNNAKNNIFSGLLFIAQQNIGVYLLLKYFSEPLTWSSLYKIMETLETLEALHDKAWKRTYSKADRTKFTNPANNYSLIGIDSRHGFKLDSLKENTGSSMSLIEAKQMFIDCTKSYLNFKFNELKA